MLQLILEVLRGTSKTHSNKIGNVFCFYILPRVAPSLPVSLLSSGNWEEFKEEFQQYGDEVYLASNAFPMDLLPPKVQGNKFVSVDHPARTAIQNLAQTGNCHNTHTHCLHT